VKRTLLIFLIGLFLNWWPFARWQDDQLVANGITYRKKEKRKHQVRWCNSMPGRMFQRTVNMPPTSGVIHQNH
jgi:hypothetical protein